MAQPGSTYHVTIRGRKLRVSLRQDGGQVYAQVDDGPEQLVQLSPVHGLLYSLVIGSHRTELLASRSPEAILMALDGRTYAATVLDEAHARLAEVVGAAGMTHARRELRAPMPGLVVKVLCQPGETVEAGQPLVVLQAMKMENELSVPRGGTVGSVSVQPGQTVDQGQVLVTVE
jgi:biotin carboxyl carrier protein